MSSVKGGIQKVAIPGVYVPPPEGYLNISQLIDFLKCRYRWNLGYKRGISSRVGNRAIDVGSAVHAGIAIAFRMHGDVKKFKKSMLADVIKAGSDEAEKYVVAAAKARGGLDLLSEEERADYDDALSSAPQVLHRALTRIRLERFKTVRHNKKPIVEMTFQSPIAKHTGWLGFHFTVDSVLENLELGGEWLWDYKCRKKFTSKEDEEVNLQAPGYQRGLAHHGIKTVGSVMFQISSKPEGTPKILKSGEAMSKADIHCSWDTYKAALLEAGFEPKEYLDMREKLKDKRFIDEDPIYRSPAAVGWIWKEVIEKGAAAMTNAHVNGEGDLRSMHMMGCKGCWARRFCQTELMFEDTDFLLQTDYVDKNNPQERVVLKPSDLSFTD